MKVHIASDLHFEFYQDNGQAYRDAIPENAADVLILAGDILYLDYLDRLKTVFGDFCKKYKHVLYTPGNHEYYKRHAPSTHNFLQSCFESDEFPENFRLLDSEYPPVEIEGRRFLGGSMWFREDPSAKFYKQGMTDFEIIKAYEPWVYDQNYLFTEYLRREFQEKDIVVTHHLPSKRSIAPVFKNSPLNPFFVCEQDPLIKLRKPSLWVHGHTHIPCDYVLGETRVLANPKGYPSEQERAYAPVEIYL